MSKYVKSFAIIAAFAIIIFSAAAGMAASQVPKVVINKCIAYAKSKGMTVRSSNASKYLDSPNEYTIRVFGSKGKSMNVAATCDWTPKFGGKLTYDDELDYMDH